MTQRKLTAGSTTIFIDLQGATPLSEIPDIWYQVRKNVSDIRRALPSGVVGSGFNDDFGDTFDIILDFTDEGYSQRALRDYVESARSVLLAVPAVSKIEVLGAQDEQIVIEFSTTRLATLGLYYNALLSTFQQQNIVRPSGVVQAEGERVFLRVSGASANEDHIRSATFVVDGRHIRLGDLAQVRRAYGDPPQAPFRVDGTPAIGLAIAMRQGGDILALGRNVAREMKRIRADLPVGIEPTLVADQSSTISVAIGEFIDSFWHAIVIILIVSFVSLGVRPGAVVACAVPLTLAIVFAAMELVGSIFSEFPLAPWFAFTGEPGVINASKMAILVASLSAGVLGFAG
ncbi:efflux RND transporter permease subunit [Cupriavidus sp. UGS-1]|uniref:efflux RND transporter permease subunit n=1 Tax=Cupriavidus sp. UGS-1 TaxID=2899826 RepID=UPI001E2D5BD9|nr:efflux RND transporter permease subunit [Cupriavidus sp. UGS-1]MCD9120642.1 efflux RND transporter permease subunit [Cupriavidus sp. UGS-1]